MPSPAPNPYGAYLGSRDPRAALAETPRRIASLVATFDEAAFGRSYGPGKWTARQLLVHLAQSEIMFQGRVRHALITPGFVVTPFEQNDLMALEPGPDGQTALACYEGLRRFLLPLVEALTPDQWARTCTHPERGPITAGDILATMAGHELLHLQHLEIIAGRRDAVTVPA